jgi:hypothetical protein
MAITGVGFTKEFERRIDKDYNDYYSSPELNEFYKRTLQAAITAKYRELDNQRRFDELRGLLVRNKQVTATSGRIALQPTPIQGFDDTTGVITTYYPHNALIGDTISVNITGATANYIADVTVLNTTELTITVAPFVTGAFVAGQLVTPQSVIDYMHLFSVNATYEVASEDEISVVTATPQKVIIDLSKRSSLRDGDMITISGVLGATNMNGIRYVNRIGAKKYQLYTDASLSTPLTANAAYVSGGDIFNTYTNACFEIKPDMETVQKVDEPSAKFPRYQMGDNALILVPTTGVKSVSIDYIKTPPYDVDSTNDTTNLELFYSREFINFWIDFSARLFALNTKDMQSLNMDNPQIAATI